MTTIGFIGSGKIGGTVARLAVAAGYDVVLSNSRGPETLAGLVSELGAHARAATAAEAAEAGDIVVVSIPVHAIGSVPAAPLAGKPVIDTGNYYPQRDGQIAELDGGSLTSSGLLQRHLPGAHVVKLFNNIYASHLGELARPKETGGRAALPLFGDDPGAKAAVIAFLTAIGYDAVDGGPLGESWRQEPGTPVYGRPYGTWDGPRIPAGTEEISAALAQAEKAG
jgi:predicted dinucleotide-binding enzyme